MGNGSNQGSIGYASSPDGITWTKYENNPILEKGDVESWEDLFVVWPQVIFKDDIYHMWYSGHDGQNVRIGYATSPDGINWTRYSNNPIPDIGPQAWDNRQVWRSKVLFMDGVYIKIFSSFIILSNKFDYL